MCLKRLRSLHFQHGNRSQSRLSFVLGSRSLPSALPGSYSSLPPFHAYSGDDMESGTPLVPETSMKFPLRFYAFAWKRDLTLDRKRPKTGKRRLIRGYIWRQELKIKCAK